MKKPLKGKPVPKAKTHHHAKPVPVTKTVKTARHAAAVKAAKTRAANAKKAKHHPRRQLALGEGVACCSAEALAASLRLTGAPVSDEDVLALYWRTAGDADAGASILATLEAAAEFGLAGVRLASFARIPDDDDPWRPLDEGRPCVILGLDLPGPHTVADDGSSWWSWGEPYDMAAFPGAVIEEAWTIEWEV